MNLIPHNKYIVCKQLSKEINKEIKGIFISQQDPLTQYEVVNPGLSSYKTGDIIVINSIPTKVAIENQSYVMICVDNIIGVIS